jgi:hypothetical protein
MNEWPITKTKTVEPQQFEVNRTKVPSNYQKSLEYEHYDNLEHITYTMLYTLHQNILLYLHNTVSEYQCIQLYNSRQIITIYTSNLHCQEIKNPPSHARCKKGFKGLTTAHWLKPDGTYSMWGLKNRNCTVHFFIYCGRMWAMASSFMRFLDHT